ncbi:MAG: peptide deformylase [Phycisphaerales bacterium]|nr:peptide deformylase [Phycisphaerales bacterium]
MIADPSKLLIELYPTEILRAKAPQTELTDEVRTVAERMVELMQMAEGIGLAAPQVGLSWRLFVAHVPHHEDDEPQEEGLAPSSCDAPQAFLNPEIIEYSKDLEPYEEGCLSLPGIRGDVRRPTSIIMRATLMDGSVKEFAATGLLARCWQHEIDHLDGVMILDKMTQISRLKNRAKIKSLEKSRKR